MADDSMSDVNDNWFRGTWRPAACWVYLMINLFDLIIAPALTMVLPNVMGIPYAPWQPLTLSSVGGTTFHMSFGAIIGVAAWGRTAEKIKASS